MSVNYQIYITHNMNGIKGMTKTLQDISTQRRVSIMNSSPQTPCRCQSTDGTR